MYIHILQLARIIQTNKYLAAAFNNDITNLFIDPGVSHWGDHRNYWTDKWEPWGKIAEWAKMNA